MGIDDKAWRALESLARELNEKSPEAVARKAIVRAKAVGVRVLDGLVSRLAGRRVDTAPRRMIDSGDGAWVARAIAGTPGVASATASPPSAHVPSAEEAGEAFQTPPEPAATPPEALQTPAATPPEALQTPPEPAGEGMARAPLPADDPFDLVVPNATAPLPSLPPRYGIDRVVLLAGESEWVFVYWETDPARVAGVARAELRLISEEGALVGRAYVDPVQGRQHLRVPARGRRYHAELVHLDGALLSRSRDVVVRAPESP